MVFPQETIKCQQCVLAVLSFNQERFSNQVSMSIYPILPALTNMSALCGFSQNDKIHFSSNVLFSPDIHIFYVFLYILCIFFLYHVSYQFEHSSLNVNTDQTAAIMHCASHKHTHKNTFSSRSLSRSVQWKTATGGRTWRPCQEWKEERRCLTQLKVLRSERRQSCLLFCSGWF